MASAKDLRKKIASVSNTRKITRTMEMVATTKSQRTTRRVVSTTPYSLKLAEILETLSSGANVRHWLVDGPDTSDGTPASERGVLLVVTGNRGLCGGYNSNVLHLAESWLREEEERGRPTDITMVGKKGVARFEFNKVPLFATVTHIEDWPSFDDADELARQFMARFRAGEVSRVTVASTRYHSAGSQRPVLTPLLPIEPSSAEPGSVAGSGAGSGAGRGRDLIFEPDPESILEALLPFSVSFKIFRLLVEAAASEQIARRMAMKLATDNADELIRLYTRHYNRQRQAAITSQLSEIVGGSQALE